MRHHLPIVLLLAVVTSLAGGGPAKNNPWTTLAKPKWMRAHGVMAIDRNKAVLVGRKQGFKPAHEGIPMDIWRYDPATQTGWAYTPKEDAKWKLVQFSAGQQTVVTSLSSKMWLPRFKTSDGHWWSLPSGRRKGLIYTFDADASKLYTLPGAEAIYLSPGGVVWAYAYHDKYFRLDGKTDAFVPGIPWDDFAFTIGKYELAIIPKAPGDGLRSLWRKVDGKWSLFYTPYGYRADGNAYLLYKDRMLVTLLGCGVFEYDGEKDRWVRLTDSRRCFHAGFNASGERILDDLKEVLLFSGDPFDHAPQGDQRVIGELVQAFVKAEASGRNALPALPAAKLNLEQRNALRAKLLAAAPSWQSRVRIERWLSQMDRTRAPLPDSLLKRFGLREKDNQIKPQR